MTPCATPRCVGTSDRAHRRCQTCVTAWATRSRIEAGKPPTITDPVFLDQLAASVLAAAVADPSRKPHPAGAVVAEGSASGAAGSEGLGKCPEPSRPRNDKRTGTRMPVLENNAV